MSPVGFEPIISAGERPPTYALDRAVTQSGIKPKWINKIHVIAMLLFSIFKQVLNKA
jgi:hypothetical protein